MTLGSARSSSGGGVLLGIGIAFLVLGAIGIVLYATGAPDALPAGSPQTGALRAATVLAAAASMGVGALLLVLGIARRRRASRR